MTRNASYIGGQEVQNLIGQWREMIGGPGMQWREMIGAGGAPQYEITGADYAQRWGGDSQRWGRNNDSQRWGREYRGGYANPRDRHVRDLWHRARVLGDSSALGTLALMGAEGDPQAAAAAANAAAANPAAAAAAMGPPPMGPMGPPPMGPMGPPPMGPMGPPPMGPMGPPPMGPGPMGDPMMHHGHHGHHGHHPHPGHHPHHFGWMHSEFGAPSVQLEQAPIQVQSHPQFEIGSIPPRNQMVDRGEPRFANRMLLPMSSGVAILPGTTAQVTARPQGIAFRPERVIIGNNPQDWVVNDIKVGNESQLAQSGDLPGEMFSSTTVDGFVTFRTVQSAMDFVMQVTYIGPVQEGAAFICGVLGTQPNY